MALNTGAPMNVIKKILVLSLVLLAACSTPRPEGETEAEVLYKEAQALVNDGRYLIATEKLNTLRSKFPYSYFATHAELLLADVLFKQENYTEAAASYILFRDFHPKHERSDYVLWKIAESFYQQIPDTFDRDLSGAIESIRYYNELLRVYPKSEYIDNAREKIARSEQMLRDKERYIADFYFKTEVWDAARYRYEDILKNFREVALVDHASIRVLQSTEQMGDEKVACEKFYKKYLNRVSDQAKERYNNAYESCRN